MTTVNKVDNKNLVFIVGSGRSGTTLLRTILDNHPKVGITPEIGFFSTIMPCYSAMNLTTESGRRGVALAMRERINSSTDPLWNLFADQLDTVEEDIVKYGQTVKKVYCILLNRFSTKSGPIIATKTPANIFMLPVITRYFPNAKIIHMVRNPHAVVASLLKLGWSNSHRKSAVKWKQAVEIADKVCEKSDTFLELRYEDLANEPEKNVRNVCDFSEIDYLNSLIKIDSSNTAYDIGNYKGIYTPRKKYDKLSRKILKDISYITLPNLLEKGYEKEAIPTFYEKVPLLIYKNIALFGHRAFSQLKWKGWAWRSGRSHYKKIGKVLKS